MLSVSGKSDQWNWVPLKLSSPAKFMINLSVQNFILFLFPPPIPLRIEEYQRKGGIETKQDPVGPSRVQKPLCVPISCL